MKSITLAPNYIRDYDGPDGGLREFTDSHLIANLLNMDSQSYGVYEVIHDEIGTMFYHRISVKLSDGLCFRAMETSTGDWWVERNLIQPFSQLYFMICAEGGA